MSSDTFGADPAGEGAAENDGAGPEDRAGDGVAHLQAAARELIAAFRAFLDVAEELVEDPKAGEALVATLGDVARRVVPRTGGADDDGEGFQRITLDD